MRLFALPMLAVLAVLAVGHPRDALADDGFRSLPVTRAGKGEPAADRNLKARVVSYDGSTNGALTIDVKNTGAEAAVFVAQGLYFVPGGDPKDAPQRLGAVGPFELAEDRGKRTRWTRRDTISIAAGDTVRLRLDVFCIDSHRASPNSSTRFTVAKTRMPRQLSTDIETKGRDAARKAGGFAAPAAKPAVQSEVWKSRDADWIELDGEGAQEAGKRRR